MLRELESIASQVDDVAARAGNQGNVQTELMSECVVCRVVAHEGVFTVLCSS